MVNNLKIHEFRDFKRLFIKQKMKYRNLRQKESSSKMIGSIKIKHKDSLNEWINLTHMKSLILIASLIQAMWNHIEYLIKISYGQNKNMEEKVKMIIFF